MELAFKLDGVLYEVDKITLGDARMVADLFGVTDLRSFDWTDPRYMAALVYLGLRDKNRFLTSEQLMAQVDQVDLADLSNSILEIMQERAAAAVPPTGPASEPTLKPAPRKRPKKQPTVS